ncbi:reverse transcriptase domain-containing protein [Tanacetum coccineum]
MLERLSRNEYYCFLNGFSGFFQISIALKDQEKTTFTCAYGTFAYRRTPFGLCNAPMTFQRFMTAIFHDMVEDFICEETNLVLNLEKCHFMVKEGIVLGNKISGKGIEVDKAKIDVIAKLPYPTNVKGVRSFLGHDGFYRRFIQDFSMISKPMTQLLMKDANKQDAKPRLIRWVLLHQGFNIEIKDKKRSENLAADHLSRLENPNIGELAKDEIEDKFPDEHLMILKAKLNDEDPWYVDFVNYIVRKVVPPDWTPEKKKCFFSKVKNYFWDEPYAFRLCPDNVMRRCDAGCEIHEILEHCHFGQTGGHHSASVTRRKVYEVGFYWPSIFKDAKDYVMKCDASQALPTNDDRVVVKFLKGLFARFRVPKALNSDRGTHFCNSQLEKALLKYGVTHRISTSYYLQTNDQTEVTNRAIKRILERSVRYNPKDWSEKLNDALWAFRTAYKTPIGCTPFRMVYRKACHLPVKIEHKTYCALKQCNIDLTTASKNHFIELNELMELRDKVYENTQIYKERTKKWHDSRLRGDKDFKNGEKEQYGDLAETMCASDVVDFRTWPDISLETTEISTIDLDGRTLIVNGDSPPPKRTVDDVEKTYPPTTAEEKLERKNELKAKGNKESRKTQKIILKQQYENFNGSSSEGLDQTYDRLQKIISQLEILGETSFQEDMNLKFLRSLLLEWKIHTLIWRNKPDLETLSMDDLYNNLKIYENEVKGSSSSKEMDLKWQMAMLTMRAKRFLNKTGRKISANGYKTIGFNKSKIKALVAQDGLGYDWSDQAEEGPTNFTFMAYTSSSSSSLNSEVSTCSKACLKSYETLKEHYDNLTKDFNKSQLNVGAYKASLEYVEARLDMYKKNEAIFEEDIKILKLDVMLRDNALTELRKKIEKAKKESDDLKLTLEKFNNSSKNLSKLLEIQVSDKFKTGVGYDSQVVDSQVFDSQVNDKYKTCEGYHVVPPPYTGNFMPPKSNLELDDKDDYVFSESVTSVPAVAISEANTSELKPKSVSETLIKD